MFFWYRTGVFHEIEIFYLDTSTYNLNGALGK